MKYYYHGVGDYLGYALETIIKIIDGGEIRIRDKNNSKLKHVCLYKKNDEYNYHKKEWFMNSARGGWIDHCSGFIISPELDAYYYEPFVDHGNSGLSTNLVDEWRYDDNISLDMIKGIFLPFAYIRDVKQGKEVVDCSDFSLPDKFKGFDFNELLQYVISFARSRNWIIVDSDVADFTDKLDDTLEEKQVLGGRK